MDIKLGPNNDLLFDGKDLDITRTKSETLAQRLTIKLLTFRDEWFLDTNEGIPYYQSIFGKNRAKESIDTIFKKAVLEDDDVFSIIFFNSTISPERSYTLSFSVRSNGGEESIPISLKI